MSTDFIQPGIFNHPRPKKSVLPPHTKRRKIDHKIEEISFDTSKREDYLTGFHKRKLQRIKRAQEENEKKAREERRQMRKQVCISWFWASLRWVVWREEEMLIGIGDVVT
jgi:ribosomal RNA-processing protein 17